MAADASAYAALGLEPGADFAAVERAYKKLIKEHHPDRAGGDSERAAEINRAYRELRSELGVKNPLDLNDWTLAPRRDRAWLALAILLVVGAIGFLLSRGPLAPFAQSLASPGRANPAKVPPVPADVMDQPLDLAVIDEAAGSALRLSRTRDEMALASASRDCHHILRSKPSLSQLDRCAAFDDAVVQLQDRDPLRDQGPFSEIAVTGRIWSGASALSDDSVAIDGRLDRIRLRVELALATEVQPKTR
jgi:hypothetical protein